MKCLRMAFLAVLLMAWMQAAAYAQALADRIPDDALIYVGWAGTEQVKPAYQGSHLKAIIDATSWEVFVGRQLPRLLEQAGAVDPDVAATLKAATDLGGAVSRYPTAVYVGPMDIRPRQEPKPRLAVVCQAGPEAEKLERQVRELLEKAGPGPVPVVVDRAGGVVVLQVGDLGPAEAVLLGKSNEGTLAKNAAFQAALGQVQKDAALTAYVNVPAVVALADKAAVMDRQAAEMWPKVREALGLASVQQAVMTAGFDGRDWGTRAFIGIKGPRVGVVALLDGPPVTDEQLKLVPASATWMTAGSLSLSRLYAEVMGAVAKVSPETHQQVTEMVGQAGEQVGFDIPKDLLGSLGEQWVAYSAPTIGGASMLGTVLVSPVANPAKLTECLDKLERFANQLLAKNLGMGSGPNIRIHQTIMDGVQLHHISLFVVTPAWAVHQGRLYVSAMPQAIPAAVAATVGKNSILTNEGFVAVRKRLGVDKPATLTYVDLPRTALESYPLLTQVMSMVGMFAGADAPPSLLPPLHKLLPELAPAGGATWNDAAGWHYKSISPVPGSILLGGQQTLGMAAPAMGAAILLPSLGRARELANRSHEAANLRGISQACVIYANENNDKMPEHLAELVANGTVSPKTLVSKRSVTRPAEFTAEQMAAARKDWHTIEKEIEAHCDFVYLGKKTQNNTDPTLILAFTDPKKVSSRDGMNMAYYDCHVEWIRSPSIPQEFEATNKMRKKAGLAEVDMEKLLELPRPVQQK